MSEFHYVFPNQQQRRSALLGEAVYWLSQFSDEQIAKLNQTFARHAGEPNPRPGKIALRIHSVAQHAAELKDQ